MSTRLSLEERPATMCVAGTPLESYPEFGLLVKREDLSCPDGPHFSKTRGVWERVASRPQDAIGVLDTRHSQGGWAVARACYLLGKRCWLYYPQLKADGSLIRDYQLRAQALGAELRPLRAGRSAVLYHQARRVTEDAGGYMMPNALKLFETVEQTASEVGRTLPHIKGVDTVLISASSGTIAAGVIRGFQGTVIRRVVVHMGYSRSLKAIQSYVADQAGGMGDLEVEYVDELYAYSDPARPGPTPPFPCNQYYDLKAFRWWCGAGRRAYGAALLWNVG